MNEIYHEKPRDIPIYKKVDILVAGGGTAGVPAAIAAARCGKKTLLLEQLSFLGGSATAALVTPLMHTAIKDNPTCSINREINQRLIEAGGCMVDETGNDCWFDPVILSCILEEIALSAGVEILYNTFVSDVIKKDNILKGIIIENKGGRQAIFAKRTIDATGDADLAFRCGCPCSSGRPETGINQPVSLRFEVGGIDEKQFSSFLKSMGQKDQLYFPFFHTAMIWNKKWPLTPIFEKALEAGDIEKSDTNYFQAFGIPGKKGSLSFNCPEIPPEKDVTRPDFQSASLSHGRKAIMRLIKFMKKYLPGFENAYVSQFATMLGIRESRRIVGEYVLTGKDLLGYKKFDDAISRNNYPVDIHGAELECGTFEIPDEADRYHEIPYRSLVPKGIENLLVAGRCFSSDFVGQSSPRIQPICRAMGEAAGIASAISLDEGITPRKLDGRKVREYMKSKGTFL
jgi:FAD-dependent oxidoreductase family protein